MYAGNMVPNDWPQRADRATYEKWARLPSWHLEEAASLVCRYRPRSSHDLPWFPLDSRPTAPPPSQDAKTWNELLHGDIGGVLGLYRRFEKVSRPERSTGHVVPAEFVKFCDQFDIDVPSELRRALSRRSRGAKASETRTHKSRYRERTIQVARDLKQYGVHVTMPQLKILVEGGLAPRERRVGERTFQAYLDEWRKDELIDDPLRSLLEHVLREPGRPSEDDDNELRLRLPKIYAQMLAAAGYTTKIK
jgi:hypothetical protein